MMKKICMILLLAGATSIFAASNEKILVVSKKLLENATKIPSINSPFEQMNCRPSQEDRKKKVINACKLHYLMGSTYKVMGLHVTVAEQLAQQTPPKKLKHIFRIDEYAYVHYKYDFSPCRHIMHVITTTEETKNIWDQLPSVLENATNEQEAEFKQRLASLFITIEFSGE